MIPQSGIGMAWAAIVAHCEKLTEDTFRRHRAKQVRSAIVVKDLRFSKARAFFKRGKRNGN